MPLAATIRSIYGLLDRRKRTQVVLVALLSAGNAILEAVGALLVLALVGSVTAVGGLPKNPVISLFDRFAPGASVERMTTIIAVATLVFYVVRGMSVLTEQYAQQRLVHQAASTMSTRVLSTYLRVPITYHYDQTSGEMLRDAWYASEMLFRMSLLAAMSLMSETLAAIALLTTLLIIAPGVTIAVVVALGLSVLAMDKVLRPKMSRWGTQTQDLSAVAMQHLQDSFAALRDVRMHNAEEYFAGRYEHQRRQLARVYWRQGTAANAPRFLLEALFMASVVAVVLVTSATNGDSSDALPLLGVYAYTGLRLLPAANRTISALTNLRYGEASAKVVIDALHSPQEDDPPAQPEPMRLEREIRFRDVTYSYPRTAVPALRDLSVVIEKGQRIGVVGHSGSGKSTFVDLLAGLLRPSSGQVEVDGMPIADRPRDWRSLIGYVPQATLLLDDTISANVAFGIPEALVDPAAVWSALERAQVADVVAALPEGLDARVGERGVKLSGGQRQRIAVARALYHEPAVLLFDEATAALDNKLEDDLTVAIEALSGTHTIVIVAHRLSTVRRCDNVLLFDGGSLVATGAFDELAETNASFRQLAALDFK